MLWPRILSGLALAPLVVAAIIWGGVLFDVMAAVFFVLAASEWAMMVKPRRSWHRLFYFLIGAFYIGATLLSLICIASP